LLPFVRFVMLGGDNDVSRLKRGDKIKTFEKLCLRLIRSLVAGFNVVQNDIETLI